MVLWCQVNKHMDKEDLGIDQQSCENWKVCFAFRILARYSYITYNYNLYLYITDTYNVTLFK